MNSGWEDPYDSAVFVEVRKELARKVQRWFGPSCAETRKEGVRHQNKLCAHFAERGYRI